MHYRMFRDDPDFQVQPEVMEQNGGNQMDKELNQIRHKDETEQTTKADQDQADKTGIQTTIDNNKDPNNQHGHRNNHIHQPESGTIVGIVVERGIPQVNHQHRGIHRTNHPTVAAAEDTEEVDMVAVEVIIQMDMVDKVDKDMGNNNNHNNNKDTHQGDHMDIQGDLKMTGDTETKEEATEERLRAIGRHHDRVATGRDLIQLHPVTVIPDHEVGNKITIEIHGINQTRMTHH
jgi:hypothetical protein